MAIDIYGIVNQFRWLNVASFNQDGRTYTNQHQTTLHYRFSQTIDPNLKLPLSTLQPTTYLKDEILQKAGFIPNQLYFSISKSGLYLITADDRASITRPLTDENMIATNSPITTIGTRGGRTLADMFDCELWWTKHNPDASVDWRFGPFLQLNATHWTKVMTHSGTPIYPHDGAQLEASSIMYYSLARHPDNRNGVIKCGPVLELTNKSPKKILVYIDATGYDTLELGVGNQGTLRNPEFRVTNGARNEDKRTYERWTKDSLFRITGLDRHTVSVVILSDRQFTVSPNSGKFTPMYEDRVDHLGGIIYFDPTQSEILSSPLISTSGQYSFVLLSERMGIHLNSYRQNFIRMFTDGTGILHIWDRGRDYLTTNTGTQWGFLNRPSAMFTGIQALSNFALVPYEGDSPVPSVQLTVPAGTPDPEKHYIYHSIQLNVNYESDVKIKKIKLMNIDKLPYRYSYGLHSSNTFVRFPRYAGSFDYIGKVKQHATSGYHDVGHQDVIDARRAYDLVVNGHRTQYSLPE